MLSLHNYIATWIISMLASTLFARVATADTIVIKADGLVFGPEIITANKGDILEFHFLPSNNSVVKGSFDHPCEPATADTEDRFFSGFLPARSNEENPSIFRVTIGSTAPFPFYCSTPAHCSKGMVGIVNGTPDQLAQYKDQAAREAAAQPNGDFPFDKMNPPDPSKPFGGELLKNPDYAAWYGGDSSSSASTGTGTATGPQGSDGYGQGAPPPPPPPPPPPASTPAASTPAAATATYTTTGSDDTTTGAVGGVTGTVVTSTGTLTYTVTSESGMPVASSTLPAANEAVVVDASKGIFGLVAGFIALVL